MDSGYFKGIAEINKVDTKIDIINKLINTLNMHYQYQKTLWDLNIIRKWGKELASCKQMEWIRRYMGSWEIGDLTKEEVHYILNRLFNSWRSLRG